MSGEDAEADRRAERPGLDRARRSLLWPTRDRLLLLFWILALVLLALEVRATAIPGRWGLDLRTLYAVPLGPDAYDGVPGEYGSFLYSPLAAQVLHGIAAVVPYALFLVGWTAAALAVYVWLARPLGVAWGAPLVALGLEDALIGNCTWLIALATVLAVRRAAAWWLVPAFTKVTLGALGALWSALRRDWRGLAIAAAAGGALLAASWAASPQMWRAWLDMLLAHRGSLGVPLLVVAVAIVVVAARSDRPWLLPVAMLVGSPVLGLYGIGLLVAIGRLLPDSAVAAARAFDGWRPTIRRALALDGP